MNGDPPIDQATAADEQEFLERQGFAPPGSIDDCRRILQGEIECLIAGHGDPRVLMEKIEHLARRIAIDMLESSEFSDAVSGMINFQAGLLIIDVIESDRFKAKVMNITRHWYYDKRGKTRSDEERRAITDPADVKEEIVEIDEAGKVSVVDSTVHTKPTIAHSDIAEYPCDVPDD